MGDRSFENPQSTNLTKILNDSIGIFELMKEKVTDQPAPTGSSRWVSSLPVVLWQPLLLVM